MWQWQTLATDSHHFVVGTVCVGGGGGGEGAWGGGGGTSTQKREYVNGTIFHRE